MRRKRNASESEDRQRVVHMRDAAKEAVFFATDRHRDDLNSDRMLLRALINCVQEIGEAAARISDAGRARIPSLPWTQVVGMRHILVHMYDRIDLDAVWNVVKEDLPSLVDAASAALEVWPPPPVD